MIIVAGALAIALKIAVAELNGSAFSGGAVLDPRNTAGFQAHPERAQPPVMLLSFTSTGRGADGLLVKMPAALFRGSSRVSILAAVQPQFASRCIPLIVATTGLLVPKGAQSNNYKVPPIAENMARSQGQPSTGVCDSRDREQWPPLGN